MIGSPAPLPTKWSPAPHRGMPKDHILKKCSGAPPLPRNDSHQRPVIEASAMTTSFKNPTRLCSILFSSPLFSSLSLFSSLFLFSSPRFSFFFPSLFLDSSRTVSSRAVSIHLVSLLLATLLSAPLRSAVLLLFLFFLTYDLLSLFFLFVSPPSLLAHPSSSLMLPSLFPPPSSLTLAVF